jgi:cobyrinic acid a,c-diamide synthase
MGGSARAPGQRIAIAQDAAFSFLYPHLLKSWRDAGAELMPFSPLADEAPRPDADIAWLPGGYPELYAGRLASNRNFVEGVRLFAGKKPVHGECGGYMVLGEGLTDAKGERHAMLGLLGLETSFAKRKLSLGYRRAVLLSDCVLGRKDEIIAGHEFHYSTVCAELGEKLFSIYDAEGTALPDGGSKCGNVTGSFFHFVDRMEKTKSASKS